MGYKDKNKQKQAQHQSYLKNKQKYYERNKKRRKKWRAWFENIMKTKKCYFCPENSLECLDWHHINPSEKTNEISYMMKYYRPFTIILEEMAKCIVVCANCHRKIHTGKLEYIR